MLIPGMQAIMFFIVFITGVRAVNDSIPGHLIECYTSQITLLPMTITSLIDIIRKIETNEYYYMDMRMLTNSIINRFWRDGIERDPNIIFPGPGVIAYTTSGFQSYKYKLLYSHLIPNSGNMFPNETLSLEERCTLHFMLSRSFDIWERGDESSVCPEMKIEQKQTDYHEYSGVKRSSCPIENGVISTSGYGSISPSHVLGAIASALQPMEVMQELLLDDSGKSSSKLLRSSNLLKSRNFSKTIDNVWAATLTGDLAEILVFQTTITNTIRFGPGGKWNDTEIPVIYYLLADSESVSLGLWQETDAEILGSIDGLILADEVKRWVSVTTLLKLSQVLEIFYTNRDGNFPMESRVCTRLNYFFWNVLSKRKTITEQTVNFAEVLAFNSPHYFTNDDYLLQHVDKVFVAFKNYASNLLAKAETKQCYLNKGTIDVKLNLYVIYDSLWDSFNTLQFIPIRSNIDLSGLSLSEFCGISVNSILLMNHAARFCMSSCAKSRSQRRDLLYSFIQKLSGIIFKHIGQMFDVSYYGSNITVINGATGDILVNAVDTIGEMYLIWKKTKESVRGVSSVDLHKGILAVKQLLESDIYQSINFNPATWVTLVLAGASSWSDSSFGYASSTIRSIKSEMPDMQFIYLCSNEQTGTMKKFTSLPNSEDDRIVAIERNTEKNKIYEGLKQAQNVARTLRPIKCQSNYSGYQDVVYEEYITVGLPQVYRIHPIYLCSSADTVKVKFVNRYYGKIEVCRLFMNKEKSSAENWRIFDCKKADVFNNIEFAFEKPCRLKKTDDEDENCKQVYFRVKGSESKNMCSERGCRFTGQLRFSIEISGLKCVKDFPTTCGSDKLLVINFYLPLLIFLCSVNVYL